MLVRIFPEDKRVFSSGPISPMVRSFGNPLTLIRLLEFSLKRSLFKRKNSFTILLTLLRTTASPVFLRIVTANLLMLHRLSEVSRIKWAVSEHFVHAVPRKSPFLSLSCFVRVQIIGYILLTAVISKCGRQSPCQLHADRSKRRDFSCLLPVFV